MSNLGEVLIGESFDGIYKNIIQLLFTYGDTSESRKGKSLVELHDFIFILNNPRNCMAVRRDMSFNYLEKEMDFYMSGSNKLEDAVKCSPFWKKCTDDGKTVNSNYGKLLFHDRNNAGFTQFEHAKNCLINSKGSKKAVMTLYNKENAYVSNDNPCTMFLRARIDNQDRLHLTTVMRSSDVYYGLPYDVPFFVFVQLALIDHLLPYYPGLQLGTYTHMANSLHFYEYKRAELLRAFEKGVFIHEVQYAEEFYMSLVEQHLAATHKISPIDFMSLAWKEAEKSECRKKKVGCVFTIGANSKGVEELLVAGYGDIADHRDRSLCAISEATSLQTGTCARDDNSDKWFETGCPSIHAEHRSLDILRRRGQNPDFSDVTVYVTHGPCDACLKMLDMVGVKRVFYDIPYKTNYAHWPDMTILQIPNPSNREPGKSA